MFKATKKRPEMTIMATGTTATSKTLKAVAGICLLLLALFCNPLPALCLTDPGTAVLPQEQTRLQNGEVVVKTTALDDGIISVTARIYIDASPEHIWQAITDYDNQKNFVPKVIDSGLISDNGSEQVIFQTGRTGVLFFRKTVHIKLRMKGEPLRRLEFRQIEGDFKVYHGEWVIESGTGGKGATLTFRAEIKPDFFAPSYFIRNVQENDLPMVLAAMKKRAESATAIGKSEKKRSPEAS
jgi:ribosome-associated toxin RatA of RatAB toxin-antitoxin module